MTLKNFARRLLQWRLGMMRTGLLPCLAAALLLAGAATWIDIALRAGADAAAGTPPERRAGARETALAPETAPALPQTDNLQTYSSALGDAGQAEQYVRTLFVLARKAGIELVQGDYKWELDSGSNTYRYQILLPVKGGYGAIRYFSEQALLAMPFAALDELTFKRESIADEDLDSSVRFTLFLAGRADAALDTKGAGK